MTFFREVDHGVKEDHRQCKYQGIADELFISLRTAQAR